MINDLTVFLVIDKGKTIAIPTNSDYTISDSTFFQFSDKFSQMEGETFIQRSVFSHGVKLYTEKCSISISFTNLL